MKYEGLILKNRRNSCPFLDQAEPTAAQDGEMLIDRILRLDADDPGRKSTKID